MLVLSQQNDPFYAGNGAEGDKARWFAEHWERFGYGSGVHLRRVHYRIVSEGNILKPDGELYENNSRCWEYMQGASRQARYLGLVDPEEIVDSILQPLASRVGGALARRRGVECGSLNIWPKKYSRNPS